MGEISENDVIEKENEKKLRSEPAVLPVRIPFTMKKLEWMQTAITHQEDRNNAVCCKATCRLSRRAPKQEFRTVHLGGRGSTRLR